MRLAVPVQAAAFAFVGNTMKSAESSRKKKKSSASIKQKNPVCAAEKTPKTPDWAASSWRRRSGVDGEAAEWKRKIRSFRRQEHPAGTANRGLAAFL